jgi:hypothetical protein
MKIDTSELGEYVGKVLFVYLFHLDASNPTKNKNVITPTLCTILDTDTIKFFSKPVEINEDFGNWMQFETVKIHIRMKFFDVFKECEDSFRYTITKYLSLLRSEYRRTTDFEKKCALHNDISNYEIMRCINYNVIQPK